MADSDLRAFEQLEQPVGGGIVAHAALGQGWRAGLELALEARRGRTVLARSLHHGPLRVQRPFHPEPDGTCHVYVLHPPGGVVGGDQLELSARAEQGARGLITTPGATKLYRSAGGTARLAQDFQVGPDARLEWFPQETIAFDGASARVETRVKLDAAATYAAWEILCLGRPAAGESFRRGALRLEHAIERAGRLQWIERARFDGGDRALTAAWGLGGLAVIGSFVVAAAGGAEESWVEAVRAAIPDHAGTFAVTLVSGVLVARYLGPSVREASALFRSALQVLRPLYAGVPALFPRIWHT